MYSVEKLLANMCPRVDRRDVNDICKVVITDY